VRILKAGVWPWLDAFFCQRPGGFRWWYSLKAKLPEQGILPGFKD
jgi:hypothetical protein